MFWIIPILICAALASSVSIGGMRSVIYVFTPPELYYKLVTM